MTLLETMPANRGNWQPDNQLPRTGDAAIGEALHRLCRPMMVVDVDGQIGVAHDGVAVWGTPGPPIANGYPLLAWSPALPLESLGNPGFKSPSSLSVSAFDGLVTAITSAPRALAS